MIITDGKTGYGKAQSAKGDGLQADSLVQLLGEKLDGFLTEKMGVLLDEIRKSKGRGVEVDGSEGVQMDDEESMRNIADLMAAKKGVDSTNIVTLGNKKEIRDEKGDRKKTIDLLGDVL